MTYDSYIYIGSYVISTLA